jgi:hypothetical protein
MSDEHEEQVTGITFWFDSSVLSAPVVEGEKFRASLALNCGVKDEVLWEDILKRFKHEGGFRVFSSNDFHIEVMDVMRARIVALEGEKAEVERELRQNKDELTRTKNALASYQVPLSAFGDALRGKPQDGVHWTEGADHERSPVERSDAGQGR